MNGDIDFKNLTRSLLLSLLQCRHSTYFKNLMESNEINFLSLVGNLINVGLINAMYLFWKGRGNELEKESFTALQIERSRAKSKLSISPIDPEAPAAPIMSQPSIFSKDDE